VVQLETSLVSHQPAFSEIPIIDVSPLLDGTDPLGVARRIGEACQDVGFFYVENHGVSPELVERMYAAARGFFALPLEEKQELHIANSGPTLRGYLPTYAENVDPENTRDFKECFDFGADEEISSPFFGPNQMPEGLPGFAATCEDYHDAMLGLARRLVSAIALSLDLPADHFDSKLRHPITIQRLLHYPPQTGVVTQEEIGIGAHTDYGFLTVLSQDDVGGLQVRNADGEWVSAPPIDGTFVINIGDLVETLTNGRYSSTLHRVINTTGSERYSIPFFLDLDFDAVVEPLEVCASDDNPARSASYRCGDHKYARFVASYAHLKDASPA
jgi:isopenicillin N synthase-like dioxygenase